MRHRDAFGSLSGVEEDGVGFVALLRDVGVGLFGYSTHSGLVNTAVLSGTSETERVFMLVARSSNSIVYERIAIVFEQLCWRCSWDRE